MTLGERIRQLRSEKNWTQPQAAEAIGIEQSYLSKLENDKSLPSAEIFAALLNAFSLDAKSFLEGMNLSLMDKQLLQIPAIATCLAGNQQLRISSIRRWLFSSALACVLGLTAIAGGQLGLIFTNERYGYVSAGVVKPGESQRIFDNWRQAVEPETVGSGSFETLGKAMSDKQQEMFKRLAEDYILTNDYRGEIFVLPVDGGSRTYKLQSSESQRSKALRKENRLLMLIGFLLTFGGLAGFLVEFRLRKANG